MNPSGAESKNLYQDIFILKYTKNNKIYDKEYQIKMLEEDNSIQIIVFSKEELQTRYTISLVEDFLSLYKIVFPNISSFFIFLKKMISQKNATYYLENDNLLLKINYEIKSEFSSIPINLLQVNLRILFLAKFNSNQSKENRKRFRL
jgi:hypothetical protein